MIVKPESILPSQNFLKANTLAFIIECIENGDTEKIPPTPIVRRDAEGKLIAIDGHNLIAVRLSRKEDIEVQIAESADDGLPGTTLANIQRNQDLHDKFDSVLDERARLEVEGISTFQDLIERYQDFLKS